MPGYAEARHAAFTRGVHLALRDSEGRASCAAVSNTFPGWSGVPGLESHPLQSSFLFNVKQEVARKRVDPYFGVNVWPDAEFKDSFSSLGALLHDTGLQVLEGCDDIVEEARGGGEGAAGDGSGWSDHGRSVRRLGEEGPVVAGRFIKYDSGFSREDRLLWEDEELLEQGGMGEDAHTTAVVGNVGHADDGLASMRTHATPVKTAGHAGDGLASMRTHATPVKTAGHASDGLASMRTHATPVKTAGHAGDGLASMRTHATPVKTTAAVLSLADDKDDGGKEGKDAGEYWLPWHIDSNFVTVLHKDMYIDETTGERVPCPDGAGLTFMNDDGDVAMMDPNATPDDVCVLQMGAFGQIYSGGVLRACRHAVVTPYTPNVGRVTYCNFWYAPWDLPCTLPPGATSAESINRGKNAMMDESYIDITMKQGFAAFRRFMTSPEARGQHQKPPPPSASFRHVANITPLEVDAGSTLQRNDAEGVPPSSLTIDVFTDIRCPYVALRLFSCSPISPVRVCVEGSPHSLARVVGLAHVHVQSTIH